MPHYSRIILNSFYNRLFPKLLLHNRRSPIGGKFNISNILVIKFRALNFCCLDHPRKFLIVNFYLFTVYLCSMICSSLYVVFSVQIQVYTCMKVLVMLLVREISSMYNLHIKKLCLDCVSKRVDE